MGHEIDLKNYPIRTDLAIESIKKEKDGYEKKERTYDKIHVTEIDVLEDGSIKIGKKKGKYITIEFEDVTDFENRKQVQQVFSKELKNLLEYMNIKKEDSCFVIGLGNQNSTPDSLGPLTTSHILVTKHLFTLGEIEEGFRNVSLFTPGVTGETGIETSDMIEGIIKKIKPDFLIVIDALAASSVERVNRTIQMTDTGIQPGSGVGNSRKELSYQNLNIPVLAIGIPTVVDAVSIVSDTILYMQKHFTYMRKNKDNPLFKLTPITNMNYLKKEISIDPEDSFQLLGMVGKLSKEEVRQLIFEVLTPIGYNLMVTPKEVDFVIEKLSEVLGNGINEALHEKVES